jgi:hypothetical protein
MEIYNNGKTITGSRHIDSEMLNSINKMAL